MEIIPAILTNNRREAEEWLLKIRDIKKFERVQVDFIDGQYANNKTIRPEELDLTPFISLLFDAHLMVVQNNIKEWSHLAGKVGYDRIIAQMESISEPGDYHGLAIDIHSPVEAIEPYLNRLEVVVVMAVEPGFGGQKFDGRTLEKIKKLRDLRKYKNYSYRICVDGGVFEEHLPELSAAGADEAAVGITRAIGWK